MALDEARKRNGGIIGKLHFKCSARARSKRRAQGGLPRIIRIVKARNFQFARIAEALHVFAVAAGRFQRGDIHFLRFGRDFAHGGQLAHDHLRAAGGRKFQGGSLCPGCCHNPSSLLINAAVRAQQRAIAHRNMRAVRIEYGAAILPPQPDFDHARIARLG